MPGDIISDVVDVAEFRRGSGGLGAFGVRGETFRGGSGGGGRLDPESRTGAVCKNHIILMNRRLLKKLLMTGCIMVLQLGE